MMSSVAVLPDCAFKALYYIAMGFQWKYMIFHKAVLFFPSLCLLENEYRLDYIICCTASE